VPSPVVTAVIGVDAGKSPWAAAEIVQMISAIARRSVLLVAVIGRARKM
jgi:hypothetical protein